MTDTDLATLRAACTRSLCWHGRTTAADWLDTVPRDTSLDIYGSGGVVADLEAEVARLLGKPAAVFFPSGTMAQQSVLRVHADRRTARTVAWHPACHLDQHEGRAYQRLHQIVGRPVGDANRLITFEDLTAVAEPLAALLVELPQRDLGGQQPPWADLVEQLAWARERGAAVHLDGARLWESAVGYGRPLPEVAALFDSIYVSFYKGIGALPGCALAGEADVMAEAREWRGRLGGSLYGMWPAAASALWCLERRLPRMPAYLEHTRAIADAVRDLDGVSVVPDPPHTSMLNVYLRTTADGLTRAARRVAEEKGIWTWGRFGSTGDPAVQHVELAVGDATLELDPAEVRDVLAALVSVE